MSDKNNTVGEDQARRFAEHPGREWRLLAHRADGPLKVQNEGTFDELVVDHWLHVESMDERQWWMRVGDARLLVSIEPDGRTRVDIERGFYAPPAGTTSSVPD